MGKRYGKPIAETRTFNGKKFHLMTISESKAKLRAKAKNIKSKKDYNRHTRIVKRKCGVAGTKYVLYGRGR